MNRQTIIDNIKAQFTEVTLSRMVDNGDWVKFYISTSWGEIGWYKLLNDDIDFLVEEGHECKDDEWTNCATFHITNGENWDEYWPLYSDYARREPGDAPRLNWNAINKLMEKEFNKLHGGYFERPSLAYEYGI